MSHLLHPPSVATCTFPVMADMLERQREGGAAVAAPAPVIAIASIIASMALVAVGNGLMFAYIPVRLGAEGFAPTWARATGGATTIPPLG